MIHENTSLHSTILNLEKEMGNLRVCFLLTHIPNPRINKRIGVFKKSAKVHVVCARRSSQDIYEPAHDVDHTIYNIDLPSANHIIKRYVVSQKYQKKAFEKLCELQPNVIYAEGLDMLMIANKYKKNHHIHVIFEVADLRENFIEQPKCFLDKIITNMIKKKERDLFKIVEYLVITSPKFYDLHYCSLISENNVVFIPNVPDLLAFKKYRKKNDGDFTVGFIGGIRYLSQMKMLVDAAERAECKVLFAGAGGTSNDYAEIQAYCKEKDFVCFTGRYDYATQIADLYGMVDCVYAVYDADNPNVRIALPNKLYESVLCELPIIVAKETYLEELVNEWGVGVSVCHLNVDELTKALIQLKNDTNYYDSFVNNCRLHKKVMYHGGSNDSCE